MISFIEMTMPYVFTVMYIILMMVYILSGKIGPAMYWFGAGILNIGVLIMARTSI